MSGFWVWVWVWGADPPPGVGAMPSADTHFNPNFGPLLINGVWSGDSPKKNPRNFRKSTTPPLPYEFTARKKRCPAGISPLPPPHWGPLAPTPTPHPTHGIPSTAPQTPHDTPQPPQQLLKTTPARTKPEVAESEPDLSWLEVEEAKAAAKKKKKKNKGGKDRHTAQHPSGGGEEAMDV